MRHFKNFMILVMTLTAVTLTSCSSDDDSGDDGGGSGGGGAAPGVLVASVDGTTVTSVEIATFATLSNGVLQIQGNTGGTSSKAIVLNLLDYNGAGTYPLGGGVNIINNASYVETDVDLNNPTNPDVRTWQAPYNDSQVGEIIITEVSDTNVKGTFSFSCKNGADDSVRNITEGSFNIDF